MQLEDELLATGVTLSPTRNVSKDGDIVRRWMEMVLGDKFLGDLPAALRSGELLCDLVNKLYKALGMKSQISPVRRVEEHGGDVDALSNVLEYLRACEVLGVARQDLFQPDDLFRRRDMEKVYSNVLALQVVAVSLSSRRSIDERSSMINAPDWSPLSEHGVFVEDDDLDEDELDLESPEAVQLLQQSRWQRLLFEYEHQQQRKEENDRAGDSSASDGLGPLAHGIWRTEERIRAILMRDDRDFGPVPEELHGKLWMLASGAQLEMRKHKGQYERLLASELESTEATRQIDVDLHRTVADEDKELWTEEKSRMMRRILVAYSLYNRSLGYCQGLNYIVARSLQYLSEEEAFYLLIAIVRLVPDDYYTTMLGLAVDQHVFADLVRLQYPEVSDHLAGLGGSGMELSLACTEWFLTLFASPCERDVTFQIWDSVFLQGDEVLFRVALALLQQAKTELIACTTYGDMLKHLNELGRGDVDAHALMRISKQQDCVIRGRVEDFRAHHRLQLASGIVASTVESEDRRSSTTGRRSSESRTEPRLRIFGRKNKQSIFRHIDKIPPRLARTFDRNITDEYTESIQRDNTNLAEYYEGMQPQIKEEYWGSADSYRQWGARNVRRISRDGFAVSSSQENEGQRMKSDTNLTEHRPNPDRSDVGESGSGLTRDRRSKSSAFIHARKVPSNSANNTPNCRSLKDNDDDSQTIGRSPLAWIQRFEEWHKDMKTQKERKKAEKRLRRNQRSESMLIGMRNVHSDSGSGNWVRGAIDSSPVLLGPQPKKSQHYGIEGFSLGNRRRSNEHQRLPADNIAMLEEPSLSRSYSDPFRSPAGISGQEQRQNAIEKARNDAIDQCPMIPQHPFKRDYDGVVQKPDFDEVRKLARSGSGRTSRGFSDQSTLSRSTISYANTASFTQDPQDETNSNHSQDDKNAKLGTPDRTSTVPLLEKPPAPDLLYSPVHYRSSSMDFAADEPSACAPPLIRRIVSVPVDEAYAQQKRLRNPKRANECSQAIRERANVLQYMQRKASDASSIASSIPRSPHERVDMAARMSESSSDSSRFGDNRSGRSMPFRKSSFSFFDKLSSDLESSAHGLDILGDDAEFKTESIGRGSMSSVTTGRSSTVDEQRPMGGVISISS